MPPSFPYVRVHSVMNLLIRIPKTHMYKKNMRTEVDLHVKWPLKLSDIKENLGGLTFQT